MSRATFIVGDVFDVLATLEPNSVDLVLTSPPFLALRSYLPADHPDKAKEIGSEPTPGAFIDTLLDVTEACERVLKPSGSLVFELGDTYSGSGGAGGDYGDQGLRDGQAKYDGSGRRNRPADVAAGILAPLKRPGPEGRDSIPGWPLAKSLCLIPELYRIALVYGFNSLTGRTTPRWRARNVVRWVRPNPPVGALGDKFRPATSEMVVACKGKDRWFDLDAVRTPFTGHEGVGTGVRKGQNGAQGHDNRPDDMPTRFNTHDGAPPLDWWSISPVGYPGSHYATFPAELCVRPIEAMCPRRVCVACGEPSRRETDVEFKPHGDPVKQNAEPKASADYAGQQRNQNAQGMANGRADKVSTTTGWSTCGCPGTDGLRIDGYHTGASWRPGVVLDPFAGSGTTLAVATGHGRDAIGIDIDARNADLARERVGMFLDIDDAPRPIIDHHLPEEVA